MIGLGNPERGDDAVGLLVVRRLLKRFKRVPEGVEIRGHDGDPLALLELWRGCDAVIVVDAMRSGMPPGTVRRFEAHRKPLPARLRFGVSTHGVGLAEAIELARALSALPPALIVYAIEGERFALGAGGTLSPAVERAVEEVTRRVREELTALLGHRHGG